MQISPVNIAVVSKNPVTMWEKEDLLTQAIFQILIPAGKKYVLFTYHFRVNQLVAKAQVK